MENTGTLFGPEELASPNRLCYHTDAVFFAGGSAFRRRGCLPSIMQVDTLRELFARPPVEFGPTPFWFLNDELDEERLSLALEELKSKGIAGVVIHPRTGMEVEYLSETFWERILEPLGVERADASGGADPP